MLNNVSSQGSPLQLLSGDAIHMRIINGSSLQLTNSSLNISADRFSVSQQGSSTPLLDITDEGVRVGGHQLEVTSSLGASVAGSVETSRVQSPAQQDLLIQSLSGNLHLSGGRGIHIQDGVGFDGVSLTSHDHLTISSLTDQVSVSTKRPVRTFVLAHATCTLQVILGGDSIAVPGLPRASDSDVYEVCVCGTGATLYLVPATSTCQQDNSICTP